MIRRTTIELDDELVERAKRALGSTTTRATVEEALRRVADRGDAERAERTARQTRYLRTLGDRVDLKVLASEQMWH
jgi:Arc/MetJ family transcription regulator